VALVRISPLIRTKGPAMGKAIMLVQELGTIKVVKIRSGRAQFFE
jgi:hypothetical protein